MRQDVDDGAGIEDVWRVPVMARKLKVTPQAIYLAIKDGRLQSYKVGRAVRVPQSAAMAFLKGRK